MDDDDDAKKLQARQTLQDLLDTANASYDSATTDEERDHYDAVATAASASIKQLNVFDMQARTGDLIGPEEPLQTSINKLTTLQGELNAVSAEFAEAASVCTAIDKAITDVRSVLTV